MAPGHPESWDAGGSPLTIVSDASVALNRFGLGAGPADGVTGDPRAWLLAQFPWYEAAPRPWRDRPGTAGLTHLLLARERAIRELAASDKIAARKEFAAIARAEYVEAVGARVHSCLHTAAPFPERLVHFWANHFAVSVDSKIPVIGLAGAFESEAIRPHILGRFVDMLLAVMRHPAMLIYLDQAVSTGPNSAVGVRAASRQRNRGLNENLAREVLELHTLGVRSGYTQADVTEFARSLTGWTVPRPEADVKIAFEFLPAIHEPGARTLMGRTYRETGEQQAVTIVHDLVRAPATARHVASKLARHFIADDPPAAAVDRLAATFQRTSGDLSAMYRDLVAEPSCWQERTAKFKSPWEWAVSSFRALGIRDVKGLEASLLMTELGQPVWRPGSPAGYEDTAATWAAPDALMRRVEVAQRMAASVGDSLDARSLAPKIVPSALRPRTVAAISAAESTASALALLLVAPEFLRR